MLRLGLDLGTNSIGWALYQLDAEAEPVELVDGGVLIHSDGRNPQNQSSNAKERREKRGPRRNRDRTLRRRKRVARKLHELELLPTSQRERTDSRKLDPMRLRAEALDRPLEPHELGRVLLSFVDRRGFKSNRKADGGEDGQIRQDAKKLRMRMQQSGARSLGEFLWKRRRRGKTIRARLGNGLYPDRSMIEEELQLIRDKQGAHHPGISAENWDHLIGTLLYQRPLRPVERGWCTLIKDERRIYKADPLFQRFRIWQEVLNLEYTPPRESNKSLDERQRWLIVNKLLETKAQTFGQLDALIGLPEGSRFNLHTTAREKLDGDLTASVLGAKKRFGKLGWRNLSLDRQREVVDRLLNDENHEQLIEWLRTEYHLNDEAAEAVATARLPQGTGHLSQAAIEKLLPYMSEDGAPYHHAVQAAGLGHHSDIHGDGQAARLPYYGEVLARDVVGARPDGRTEAELHGRIGNPTVHIALGQTRRLFNAIVDEYGKPDEVVVELARELKQSPKEREQHERTIRERRQRNEGLRELASKAGVAEPTARDMRKLRLWAEQGEINARVCPFSGETLSIGRVLSDETEIEHILPYRPTLDDSMANKVLATRAANREKGARAPYEAWGSDSQRYQAILARAERLPPNKRWRFQPDAMKRFQDQDEFLARQLNDTRYLSRAVKQYLEAAVAPNRIWVTPGRLTAMLRVAWGLNSLIGEGDNKKRNDHRHHLIDAVVVGMTSRSLLQRVSRESARKVEQPGERVAKSVDDPWKTFRRDVQALVERVVVRHRPKHFDALRAKPQRQRIGRDVTSGSLHNETAYGPIFEADGELQRDPRGNVLLVETKPLAALDKRKKLEDIRDAALRERLTAIWDRVEAEAAECKLSERFADRAWAELHVRRIRVYVHLKEDSLAFIRNRDGEIYKAYKTDGNAYMDVWLLPNGKTRGETVTRFNAHQPDFRSRVKAEHPTAKKLMRLQINDMIAVGEGAERRIMRVLKLSGQGIVAVGATAGGPAKELDMYTKSAGQVLQAGLRKVSVDILGRVADGGPFDQSGRGRSR